MSDRDQKRLDARLRRSGGGRGKHDRSSTSFRKRRLPAIADAAAAPTDTQDALAARVPGNDVIFNYAFDPDQPPPVDPTFLEWELRKDHPGYDSAYTEKRSARYNHEATPDHVVFNGQDIDFFGYYSAPYYDYVFSEVYDSYGSAFILRPKNMNFHSFRQTGYLFNGKMTAAGSKTYYTGFALILECDNIAGMQENDDDAPNIATLRLYYLKNEEWDTDAFNSNWYSDTFPPSATRAHITTVKSGIVNQSTDPFRVSVETDPVNPAFKVYVDGYLASDLSEQDANGYIGSDGRGFGFGFFTSYYSHSCLILTRIAYEQAALDIDYVPLERAEATVRFVEQDNPDHAIRDPETEEGWVLQRYRISQPKTIVAAGATVWILRSNSLSQDTGDDIRLTYTHDAKDNETTLFYVRQGSGKQIGEEQAAKTARVNGGEWEAGSDLAPIAVAPGDEIEYSITVFCTPPGPMLTIGNSWSNSDTSWYNQTSPTGAAYDHGGIEDIPKHGIISFTFVNLPENYADPEAFFDAQPDGSWDNDGQPVLKVWDATETDPVNQFQKLKVYVWLTRSDVAGKYRAFIGGMDGVWMSTRDADTFQFGNFKYLTVVNGMEHFHAEKAKNMNYMFYACGSLTMRDLSPLDTSNVTSMRCMFYYCTGLATLDLSDLDTSNVKDMSYMFGNCSGLVALNLSHIDTRNVTDMSYMFFRCSSLTKLDLPHFDTRNVTNMSDMFYLCRGLSTLDLSHFDTHNVTDMSYMFGNCNGLTTLDLSTWNTLALNNVTYMVYGCNNLKKICWDNADFTSADLSGKSNVFPPLATGLTVYVKDDANKIAVGTWGYASGVEIVDLEQSSESQKSCADRDPVVARIQNPSVVGASAKAPPAYRAAVQMTLTDTIPDGLQILTCSPNPDDSPATVDEQTNTVTWSYNSDNLPWVFTANVEVPDAAGPQTPVYVNSAVVMSENDFSEPTNETYHKATEGYLVTERYYIWDGLSDGKPNLLAANMLDDDLITDVADLSISYTAQPLRHTLSGSTYKGYMRLGIDADLVPGDPPDPVYFDGSGGHSPNIADTRREILVLFYERQAQPTISTITVHFVDADFPYDDLSNPNYDGETSVSLLAPQGVDYWLPLRYMGGFADASVQPWSYVDYKDSYTPNDPPSTGSYTLPRYPLGDPDHPLFTAAQMQDDQAITLYFKPAASVVVRYVELNRDEHILHTPDTSFASIDLTLQGRDDGQSYYNDSITAQGKEYTYSGYYNLDSVMSNQDDPLPTDVSPGTEGAVVTLYFTTVYKVTEMFHGVEPGVNEHEVYSVTPLIYGLDGVSLDVSGGNTFHAMDAYNADKGTSLTQPPQTIAQGGVTWDYLGWRVGWNDDEPLQEGFPPETLIDEVWTDAAFIYVYDKGQPSKTARVSKDNGVTWSSYETGTQKKPVTVKAGAWIEYTIRPRPGDGTFSDGYLSMTVTDLIPLKTTFVSSVPVAGVPGVATPDGTRTRVTWEDVQFQPGMEFVFVVSADADGVTIENTAAVAPFAASMKGTNPTWHIAPKAPPKPPAKPSTKPPTAHMTTRRPARSCRPVGACGTIGASPPARSCRIYERREPPCIAARTLSGYYRRGH